MHLHREWTVSKRPAILLKKMVKFVGSSVPDPHHDLPARRYETQGKEAAKIPGTVCGKAESARRELFPQLGTPYFSTETDDAASS